jgi:Na+/H+ antiporter NhaA
MEKSKEALAVVSPLVIAIGCYLVFSTKIASKPDQAGFWIILALGITLGVALSKIIQWLREKRKNNE